jgi:hypothetical protein
MADAAEDVSPGTAYDYVQDYFMRLKDKVKLKELRLW